MQMLIVFLFILYPTSFAYAQEEPLTEVTVDGLVERLKPAGVRLRSARGITVEARELPSVDLAVNFSYDSAELTDEARRMLDVVARSLATEALQPHRFLLAGHTDARGSVAYNQRLSEARAEAVRTYLGTTYGIDAWRFETVGYGETRLLFPDAPEDSRNRRVEIVTLE